MSFDNYNKIEKIGEGSYGIVYKAINKNTNSWVALKKILLNSDSEGVPSTSLREISILKSLSHKNVVRLEGVIQNKSHLFLIFEYLNQDLKTLLDSTNDGLKPALIKSYIWQLLKGISYCHDKQIIHRDMKPQNLLIDFNGYIKIGDFGLGRAIGIPLRIYTHEVVTLWYRAPEILLGSKYYGFSIDIWSLGCIFAEMSNKKPLFSGDSEIDQLFRIFKKLGTPDCSKWPDLKKLSDYNPEFPKWKKEDLSKILKKMDKDAIDLLECLLIYDPNKRLSAYEALKHVYFNDITNCLPRNYFN